MLNTPLNGSQHMYTPLKAFEMIERVLLIEYDHESTYGYIFATEVLGLKFGVRSL
jgi:hypothetical protein